jgi:hypothetical protein
MAPTLHTSYPRCSPRNPNVRMGTHFQRRSSRPWQSPIVAPLRHKWSREESAHWRYRDQSQLKSVLSWAREIETKRVRSSETGYLRKITRKTMLGWLGIVQVLTQFAIYSCTMLSVVLTCLHTHVIRWSLLKNFNVATYSTTMTLLSSHSKTLNLAKSQVHIFCSMILIPSLAVQELSQAPSQPTPLTPTTPTTTN